MTAAAGERLARTRLAILEHLQHAQHGTTAATARAGAGDAQARWRGIQETGRRYWRQHPARLALELATPSIGRWARRRPLAFLAVAFGAGALLVLARPWKLISVTGLLVAGLKSRHLSALAISALSQVRDPRAHPHPYGADPPPPSGPGTPAAS